MFLDADEVFFGSEARLLVTRREVMDAYLDYTDSMEDDDTMSYANAVCEMAKPMHNFFIGSKQNRLFKRKLDKLLQKTNKKGTSSSSNRMSLRDIIYDAIEDTIPNHFLDVEF